MGKSCISSIDFQMLKLDAELAARAMVSKVPTIADNKKLLVKRDTWNGQINQRVYDPLALSNNLRLTGDDGNRILDIARVKKTDWLSIGAISTHGANIPTEQDLGIGKVWRFADAPINYQCCTTRMQVPKDIDFSVQPVLKIGWSTSDINGLQCRWQVEYLWRTENESMSAAAEGTVVGNYIDSAVVNGLTMISVQLDNINTDDVCITFRICRRSDQAGDTLNGINVDLHGICLYYVSNKLGEDI